MTRCGLDKRVSTLGLSDYAGYLLDLMEAVEVEVEVEVNYWTAVSSDVDIREESSD